MKSYVFCLVILFLFTSILSFTKDKCLKELPEEIQALSSYYEVANLDYIPEIITEGTPGNLIESLIEFNKEEKRDSEGFVEALRKSFNWMPKEDLFQAIYEFLRDNNNKELPANLLHIFQKDYDTDNELYKKTVNAFVNYLKERIIGSESKDDSDILTKIIYNVSDDLSNENKVVLTNTIVPQLSSKPEKKNDFVPLSLYMGDARVYSDNLKLLNDFLSNGKNEKVFREALKAFTSYKGKVDDLEKKKQIMEVVASPHVPQDIKDTLVVLEK